MNKELRMELTQLKYFKVVAECEHFTHAAEQLYISQPSLSKAISNLEDELGLKLFEREKKSVYLNDYGKNFYMYVKKIFTELDEALGQLKDMSIGAHGDVKIATSFEITKPSPIHAYTREFFLSNPDISLHFYQQSVKQIMQLLEDREANLAFSLQPHQQPNITWIPLYSERMGLILPKGHMFANRSSLRLEEVKEERFLCNNVAPDEEDSIYHLCKMAGFKPKIGFEGTSSKIVGEAVTRGLGIAFVSERRKKFIESSPDVEEWEKDLRFIPVENEYCQRIVGLLYLRESYKSAATRLFIDGMLDFFNISEDLLQINQEQ